MYKWSLHHHYCQIPFSSVTATAFSIVHRHRQTPPAAAAIKRQLHHHHSLPSCLHLSPPPPSPSSIATVKHCRPPLPAVAAAIKCHLCRCRPLPSSIASPIKCLQMPPPLLNNSAHCRRWQLQREAESSGREQCLMTVMAGVAAVAGGGSASSSCGRWSMNFWKVRVIL
jgi:hypothetical protein